MEAVGWTEEVLGGQLVGAGAKRISNRKVELHSFGAGKRRQVFVSPHGPDYRVPRGKSRPMDRELKKFWLTLSTLYLIYGRRRQYKTFIKHFSKSNFNTFLNYVL